MIPNRTKKLTFSLQTLPNTLQVQYLNLSHLNFVNNTNMALKLILNHE
jgi:hypothetical protein